MAEEPTALETQESAQAENEPQGSESSQNPSAEGSRTYTQEEFEAALEAAVKERAEGAIRERVGRANKQKKELSSENKELTAKVDELTAQLAEMQTKEHLRELVNKVSEESGVPAELLRGTTEEELAAHAEALKAYIEKPSAPYVGSDGFAADSRGQGKTVEQKFGDYVDELLS